jgi:3-deoxy-D-manno-octulosonic-acid transferase
LLHAKRWRHVGRLSRPLAPDDDPRGWERSPVAYLLDLLYAIVLALFSPALVLAAIRQGKYREGWGQKLLGLVPRRDSTAKCAWLHAVSLGEVSLIGPLVAEIRRRHPDWDIAISSSTLTGYTLARSRYAEHTMFYCPLDFSWAVRRAMRRLRPDLLVLAELELWPNLISAARATGARVAIINGRLSDRSFRRYRRLRPFARWLLAKLDLIAAQNPLSADRFLELGAPSERVFVTGSLKFDGAQSDRGNPSTVRLRQLAGFGDADIVYLAGSTQHPEEQLALDAFRALAPQWPQLRLVIVPRHPDRFAEVAHLLAASGLPWQQRSQLDEAPPDARARVLLVDRVGELGAWWGTAGIAYVGGSMGPRNGQNMIEPAAYGAAVAFGPRTRNFRDVVAALLSREAAVVVHDGPELTAFVRRCLDEPLWAVAMGTRAKRVVTSQLGATGRTVDLLEALLDQGAVSAGRRSAA